MKKTILIMFLLVFSLVLVGCLPEQPSEETTEPTGEEDGVAEEEEQQEEGKSTEEGQSEEVKIEAEVLKPVLGEVKTEFGVIPREVFVYYNNLKLDPGMSDCSKVYPLKRELVETSDHAEVNALITLTLPLSQEEIGLAFVTNLPEGTQLISLKIDGDGTAYADFTHQLNTGGGSCSMLARRAQIEKTLLQFPNIKEVVISVDGQTEDVLQP